MQRETAPGPANHAATAAMASPRGRFGRGDRILRQGHFREVLGKGRRGRGEHLQVAVRLKMDLQKPEISDGLAASTAHPQVGDRRLGLSVAKAAGHAPARARLRRLLRCAFRALRHLWPDGAAVVVLVRTPWPGATLQDVVDELQAAVTKALRHDRDRNRATRQA